MGMRIVSIISDRLPCSKYDSDTHSIDFGADMDVRRHSSYTSNGQPPMSPSQLHLRATAKVRQRFLANRFSSGRWSEGHGR